jgi:hypothetical protein
MFEQPVLEVQDRTSFDVVYAAIAGVLAPAGARSFLKKLDSARLRARDFAAVLGRGLLGAEAVAAYARLGDLDRGQIREFYLESVEQVSPELRARFLKVYAYY